MDDHRWGFEEADDWEDLAPPARSAPSAAGGADGAANALAGRDPDGVVTVVVGPDADVLSVSLAENWRAAVDPRALHHSVRAAANNATMQALASRAQAEPVLPAAQPAGPAARGPAEDAPITREDALRLLAAVDAELASFTRQLSTVADQRVTAESAGRHVGGSALRGQVIDLSIDANWAASARAAEIETELLDVLRRLRRMSTPAELSGGPQGPAIAELTALLSDPQALLRRVGLLPAPTHRGGN